VYLPDSERAFGVTSESLGTLRATTRPGHSKTRLLPPFPKGVTKTPVWLWCSFSRCLFRNAVQTWVCCHLTCSSCFQHWRCFRCLSWDHSCFSFRLGGLFYRLLLADSSRFW